MPDTDAPDPARPGADHPRGARYILTCLAIGLLAGLMSGLFGVGGGTVIVPLLVLVLAMNQRIAAGTSLAAIIPIASVGVISYALNDSVAWIPGLLLAAGAVVGAQIGTWLLPRVSLQVLRWSFIGFLVVVIVSLFIVVPSRDAGLPLNVFTISGLVVLGVVTGTVAGLIGVGACTTTALGAWIATIVDPFWGNVLFAAFLVFIAVQLAVRTLRARRRR